MKFWYYTDNCQLYGPFQDNDIRELIKCALLTPDTLVWNDGPGDAERGWVRAAETELSALFNDNRRQVSRTLPSSIYQSNFSEYKPGRRQFKREEKTKFRYVKYSFAILLFVVIVIAALARLGAGNTNNSLIDNPPAEAVGTAIQQIDTITEIGIVTEDNDPNHQLGKRGGYTGCLFFTDSNAPKIDGTDIIERGTDGGGCIEIYANANDAKKRDKYLGSFDGSIFASGSHTVVGTLVVRTSSKMKISQQKKLESQLIDVLNGKSPSVSVNAPKKVAAQSTRVLIEHGETEVGTITTTPENATIPGSTSVQSIDSAYQAILDEYSKKIRTVTPRLIDEYRAEAAKNSAGLMGLAQISMTKVSKLAEISNEGISKMAEIMMSTGMGKYEVYEAWSEKLMGVYTKEAEKITDTYHYNEDFKLTNPHQYDSCFV